MSELSSSANQAGNLVVPPRAEAANDDVLRTFERSMFLAMRNDPRSISLINADSCINSSAEAVLMLIRVSVSCCGGNSSMVPAGIALPKPSQSNSTKMIVMYRFNILGDWRFDVISRLMVLNKIDLADPEELENQCEVYHAIAIFAIDRRSLGKLINEISTRLNPESPAAEKRPAAVLAKK